MKDFVFIAKLCFIQASSFIDLRDHGALPIGTLVESSSVRNNISSVQPAKANPLGSLSIYRPTEELLMSRNDPISFKIHEYARFWPSQNGGRMTT